MRQFSEEELRKYNGQDGMPAYVAFEGNVYDVTLSNLWENGEHFKKHFAGNDLTEAMSKAPHSEEVFENYPLVGIFISPRVMVVENEEVSEKERYKQWYSKYHPHPMLIHFPIALHYFSAFTDVLFLAHPSSDYEAAVFLSFLLATVMGLFALIAGVFSWWVNYDFMTSKPFVIKLSGALFTLIVGLVPLAQKLLNGDVPFDRGIDGFIYHSIIFLTVISVTIVAYYGGKITWGSRQ